MPGTAATTSSPPAPLPQGEGSSRLPSPGGRGEAATESRRVHRTQWLVLAAALLGWMFDGVEMGLCPIVSRPAMIDLLGLSRADSATLDNATV